MIEITNLIFGLAIIILNIIPLFTKPKYYRITIPLSLLLGAIKVIFLK